MRIASSPAQPSAVTIYASTLFDPKLKQFIRNASITIDPTSGLIVDVCQRQPGAWPERIESPDIDLRGKVVMPGLVDAHTHIFLHAYSETPALNQMRDESFVERIVRATNHCKAALLSGYTTYRDLGTEGLGTADVSFRDTVNRGIIPGPRLFVATEAIASSGGYSIRIENTMDGTSVPRISDPADGVNGVRAAVHRRIGAGADVIKFYADYRKRQLRFPPSAWPGAPPIQFPPDPEHRNPNLLLFTQEEMDSMVSTAEAAKAPIAAHASSPEAVSIPRYKYYDSLVFILNVLLAPFMFNYTPGRRRYRRQGGMKTRPLYLKALKES
jgi:hypothetical protein